MEEETITEDSARSSSEEFDGTVETLSQAAQASANGSANARRNNNDDDDDGLTDLEKALIIGLGAVVVGQQLQDNAGEVVSKSDDRVVVLRDGQYRVIKDDNELLRRPGSNVRTETFNDGSSRTTVTREDGSQIITLRDDELRVLRRIRVDTNGDVTVLIDDTSTYEPVDVATLPEPREQVIEVTQNRDALRQALAADVQTDRRFALYQVRNIRQVRKLAPAISLDNVTFETGSAVITPDQAEELADLGNLISDVIAESPNEVFLIEGHTDAVGNAAYNLALSDRRAESVALALTEYFDVPPENMVVQGYGESDLKIRTLDAERENRRAAVRRITSLLQTAELQ